MTAVAPVTSTLRKASSPARVMTPGLTLPAVEWSFGVRPSQAAKCRADRKSWGAGVFITNIDAPIGPTLRIPAKAATCSNLIAATIPI
jgi:hypothetical protein